LEAMLSKLDFQGARYTMAGDVPGREGNHHPTAAPMGVFKASDGHVNLAATTSRMWRAFCYALGLEHLLDDARFSSNTQRVANRKLLIDEIEKKTALKSQDSLIQELNAIGCPCGPIYTVGEAFDDPQVEALRMRLPTDHPAFGEVDLVRSPINLSSHPEVHRRASAVPRRGEHTSRVLESIGLSANDIEMLKSEGII